MSGDAPSCGAAGAGAEPASAVPATAAPIDKIRAGVHPLDRLGVEPVHVLLAPEGTGTCGTCRLRDRPYNPRRRNHPKCSAGSRRVRTRRGCEEIWPRASLDASTNVRSWWPACIEYNPRKETP